MFLVVIVFLLLNFILIYFNIGIIFEGEIWDFFVIKFWIEFFFEFLFLEFMLEDEGDEWSGLFFNVWVGDWKLVMVRVVVDGMYVMVVVVVVVWILCGEL